MRPRTGRRRGRIGMERPTLTEDQPVFVRAHVAMVFKDGSCFVNCGGCYWPDDVVPDSPHLPAIARFLHERPELGQHLLDYSAALAVGEPDDAP